MNTKEQIARLRELDAKRTPGEWLKSDSDNPEELDYLICLIGTVSLFTPDRGIVPTKALTAKLAEVLKQDDAEFIAASPEMMPIITQLEAENAELKARLAMAGEALDFYSGSFTPYQQFKHLPGLAWKPTEALLDDCGNLAEEALKATDLTQPFEGKDNG